MQKKVVKGNKSVPGDHESTSISWPILSHFHSYACVQKNQYFS